MIGRNGADFVYPTDLESTRIEMRQARRGRSMRNFETRYVHKRGHIVTLAWSGVWSEPVQQYFFTGRDVTPEAVEPLFEKRMDGFATLFLMISHAKIGTSAIQTRATAGVAGATYIFCLPGSPGACRDGWDEILVHQLDYRYRPCNFVEIMPRLDEHLRRAKAKGATV